MKLKKVILIILLPTLSLGLFYSIKAISLINDYKIHVSKDKDDINFISIPTFKTYLFIALKQDLVKVFSRKPLLNSKLDSYYLYIDNKSIALLNSNLPESGKNNYVPGTLIIKESGGDKQYFKKIKIRYRGDTSLHWFYKQKSLRINLPKNDSYKMSNKFNLINPPILNSYEDMYINKLANSLGLISPQYYPVRVFINGEYQGVYTFLSQVDEGLLRKNKKMPGSIYYGESGNKMWTTYELWDKKASRNSESKNDKEDIKKFIDIINQESDRDFFNDLNNFFNLDLLYKYMSIDVFSGSLHHDFAHNHKIYFDPYKGKFEPIEWDVRSWRNINKKDISNYPLLERVKLNPVLESDRDIYTWDLIKSTSVDEISKFILLIHDQILPDLRADGYRDTGVGINLPGFTQGIAKPFYIKEFKSSIKKSLHTINSRINYLSKLFNSSTVEIFYETSNQQYASIDIYVSGNSGVILESPLVNGMSCLVYKDVNLNGYYDQQDSLLKDNEKLFPGRKFIQGNVLHLPTSGFGQRYLVPETLSYKFFIFGENCTVSNNINLENIVTGSKVNIHYLHNNKKLLAESDSIHPWLLPTYEEQSITLSGNQYISEDTVYDKYTSVTILPGTTFYLSPDTSLFFYGQVIAKGSKEKPIRFMQAVNNKPFGSVVLQGQKTAGSRLDYIQIKNGSTTSRNLIDYTAQLNIHDTRDILLSNCIIGENFVGDDSLHLAYVKDSTIENCTFHSARSDAVDIDISQVTIKDNVFINAGNDLLDFMTSESEVVNNLFINSGDKGISVGEWSDVKLNNNFFYSNLIGIEVKDKSKVMLDNDNLIINAKVAPINLYNKNKFYDKGGKIEGKRVYILGENNKITQDKKSSTKIKKVLHKYPSSRDQFGLVSQSVDINSDWSNLELEMKKIIRSYPW